MEYTLIDVNALKSHEKTLKTHVESLMEEIKNDGMIRMPVVAERKTCTILDGHHRAAIAKCLGLRRMPAVLVDYSEVDLYPRRKGIAVSKEAVLASAASGRLYPPKTTRHVLREKLSEVNVPLEKLK